MEPVQGCIRWGVAEELCGRTSGERRYTEKQKPRMVDGRGGECRGREAGSMEDDGRHWRHRGGTTHRLRAAVWPEKEGSQEGGIDRARRSMDEELCRKLDEHGGKNMIFKMARDRTEDGRDVKRCVVIKDINRRLITESKEVLRIWAANFKELLNGKGAASCLELPSTVRREVEVEEIRQEEVETAMHKMKKARRQGQMNCG